ncbi:3-keto-disaccharide hydrolase [Thalassotalea sp. PLHSN55]|uniref:3-keto-disaccharide hydrolase n=1 Tax=Thalassotalea sp. PLHSN55 TaxID=3435888 RepID=UPI003F837492
MNKNKLTCIGIFLLPLFASEAFSKEKHQETEIWHPVPKKVIPTAIPSDAKVLFDGTTIAQWVNAKGEPARWKIKAGELLATKTDKIIYSKDKFCDMQMHVEWRTPKIDPSREGQKRGNSGIKIQKFYEVQILDSNTSRTYVNGQAASVYKQYAPLVNVTLPPQEWQSYDIFYKAPTFDSNGNYITKGRLTLLHNGVLVQNNVEIQGSTAFVGPPLHKVHGCEPVGLQFHGSPVGFRNIWVRAL